MTQFSRTELIFGKESTEKLAACRVAIFGIGGVGGYVAEALARCGVGTLDLVDDDKICLTNLNRQLLATHSSIGRYKVDVAEERIRDICPDIKVIKHRCFYLPETADRFDFSQYDYVVDAIDTVKGKLEIVERASAAGVRVICSMGAGNKIDPSKFRVADIYDTRVCPLARVMRRELKKRGIQDVKVVYSEEEPRRPRAEAIEACRGEGKCPDGATAEACRDEGGRPGARGSAPRRDIPGSCSFVPPVAGLIIAGEVICDLTGIRSE